MATSLHKMRASALIGARTPMRNPFAGKEISVVVGLDANWTPSVALPPQEHQVFTNAWRQAIGQVGDLNPITTANAALRDIWLAAQSIYGRHPELLEADRQTLFGE
jgi:hypothetical protein